MGEEGKEPDLAGALERMAAAAVERALAKQGAAKKVARKALAAKVARRKNPLTEKWPMRMARP